MNVYMPLLRKKRCNNTGLLCGGQVLLVITVEMLNKLCGGNRTYILATNNAIGEKKNENSKDNRSS